MLKNDSNSNKYTDLTREQLIEKLENLENIKRKMESDLFEKNAKLAAVITASDLSEEKLQEIFSQIDFEKNQNNKGKKANTNVKKIAKPIEPWILEIQVQSLFSREHLKMFNQLPESIVGPPMLECMVCKPLKTITISEQQLARHVNGKLHQGQMKNFKAINNPNEGTF